MCNVQCYILSLEKRSQSFDCMQQNLYVFLTNQFLFFRYSSVDPVMSRTETTSQ